MKKKSANIIGTLIILASLWLSNPALARADKAAHLGISYMATTIVYGIFKKPLRLKRHEALLMAVPLVLAVGIMKEYGDANFSSSDIAHNVLGVGLAVGATYVFEF